MGGIQTRQIALRESLGIYGTRGWMDVDEWSDWILAITPQPHEGRFEKQRGTGNESMPGYTMEKEELIQIVEKKAKSSSETGIACGIYEWAIQKSTDTERYVVYIGSTCRSPQSDSNEAGSIAERVHEYCRHGSHKKEEINGALEKGYSLLVRFKVTGTTKAEQQRRKQTF